MKTFLKTCFCRSIVARTAAQTKSPDWDVTDLKAYKRCWREPRVGKKKTVKERCLRCYVGPRLEIFPLAAREAQASRYNEDSIEGPLEAFGTLVMCCLRAFRGALIELLWCQETQISRTAVVVFLVLYWTWLVWAKNTTRSTTQFRYQRSVLTVRFYATVIYIRSPMYHRFWLWTEKISWSLIFRYAILFYSVQIKTICIAFLICIRVIRSSILHLIRS